MSLQKTTITKIDKFSKELIENEDLAAEVRSKVIDLGALFNISVKDYNKIFKMIYDKYVENVEYIDELDEPDKTIAKFLACLMI